MNSYRSYNRSLCTLCSEYSNTETAFPAHVIEIWVNIVSVDILQFAAGTIDYMARFLDTPYTLPKIGNDFIWAHAYLIHCVVSPLWTSNVKVTREHCNDLRSKTIFWKTKATKIDHLNIEPDPSDEYAEIQESQQVRSSKEK